MHWQGKARIFKSAKLARNGVKNRHCRNKTFLQDRDRPCVSFKCLTLPTPHVMFFVKHGIFIVSKLSFYLTRNDRNECDQTGIHCLFERLCETNQANRGHPLGHRLVGFLKKKLTLHFLKQTARINASKRQLLKNYF